MNTKELFEGVGDPLSGYMDIYGVAKLLPDISNSSVFVSGMNKIRLGQGGILTYAEKLQLAMAWISFVGLNPAQKSMVSRDLMAIQDAPVEQPQQQMSPDQIATAQANGTLAKTGLSKQNGSVQVDSSSYG